MSPALNKINAIGIITIYAEITQNPSFHISSRIFIKTSTRATGFVSGPNENGPFQASRKRFLFSVIVPNPTHFTQTDDTASLADFDDRLLCQNMRIVEIKRADIKYTIIISSGSRTRFATDKQHSANTTNELAAVMLLKFLIILFKIINSIIFITKYIQIIDPRDCDKKDKNKAELIKLILPDLFTNITIFDAIDHAALYLFHARCHNRIY